MEVIDVSGPSGARDGGRVRIAGPFGLHRTATTRIVHLRPGQEIVGSAALSGGTQAKVRWRLRPSVRGTCVTLDARITQARAADALLLRLGGRRWLRRRFERALAALDDAMARSA